ncbi:hypothetical protein [Amycolatopsis sp. NPDC004378]
MQREGPASKAQRDRLRREMQEQGCTLDQIAAEMATRWGFRPRQAWRHAQGWTQAEAADRYNRLVDANDAAMTGNRISDFEAWPPGGVKPTLTTLAVLARVYGTASRNLVDYRDREKFTKQELVALDAASADAKVLDDDNDSKPVSRSSSAESPIRVSIVQTAEVPLSRSRQDLSTPVSIHDFVVSAAQESRIHAEDSQGLIMPDFTVDEIADEIERLYRERAYLDPLIVFSNTVQVRDAIYRLLDRKQYPRQTTQLYYLAAVTCALLANLSDALGSTPASIEQSRASWAYAEIIGHNSLRAWARQALAAKALRDKRPRRALELAQSGVQWASEPVSRASLHLSISKCASRAGQPEVARDALQTAMESYSSAQGDSEIFDRLGGIFSFPQGKFRYESATAYLELGDVTNARSAITDAVELYAGMPVEKRGVDREAAANIVLGHVRLLDGDVEGAGDALNPAFELVPQQRVKWVVSRMRQFQDALASREGASTSAAGRHICQAVEDFTGVTAASVAAHLHG